MLVEEIQNSEAVVQSCSTRKMFLKISQNSQESTCARVSFLIKSQAWGLQLYYETFAQVFSCEICEIFKNTLFKEHFWWLLLKISFLCFLFILST